MDVKRKIQLVTLVVSICIACLYLFLPAVSAGGQKPSIDFNREVRPILSDNCFACHGPDENQRKAKLRFDTKEGAFAKPGVITPGEASKSRLYQRISSKDQDRVMTPAKSVWAVSEEKNETIRRWIDEGARWNETWAFI